ncbi:AfsR/SARP family transcriptional regulator [Streptomyces longwoodensis]|uniref:AfsR/SARP family transcriptional regulator n=1 Tax=Streptomyces longwoodensis TaxID=68231 RepID=UPI0033FBC600
MNGEGSPAVRFRLLGAVEATVGGRAVPLGHARQRCVLAVLLIRIGRPCTAADLVDRVWGEAPPQRARDTLYGYLSRLRRVLARSGRQQIITRGAEGYTLQGEESDVDLYVFRQLVERARHTDDPDRATVLFDEAFRLWRGEPFGAFETPWLDGLRVTLRQERFAAELDHYDVGLRLGRHRELLSPLRTQARHHPLDERLAGQLMLALHRCGRSSEALDHYQAVRVRLAEELGLDPGAQLRTLHERVLAADPALEATPPRLSLSSSPAPPQVPCQLPAPVGAVIGRATEFATLDQLLDTATAVPSAATVVSITGSAGIGKTTLALSWSHRVREHFPDGQLYADLRGFDPGGVPMPQHQLVHSLLEGLGVASTALPVTADARLGLYRTLIAGRRLLIVFDNARDADQVRPLLPATPGCFAIVTSRRQLPGLLTTGHVRHLTLGLLPDREAHALLAGTVGSRRLAAEPEAAAALVRLCARLPLALSIAAARAATAEHLPLAALADELRDEEHRLAALSTGDSHLTDLASVFHWSYRALSPSAARMFRLLGLHPGPHTDADAASASSRLSPSRTRAALAELTHANLLHQHAPTRYAFHDLLRVYAAERALAEEPREQRDAAVHHLLDHYLHTAYEADRLLDPHRDPIDQGDRRHAPGQLVDHDGALAWFASHRLVLLNAVRDAAARGYHGYAWKLAWTLTTYLQRTGHRDDWMDIARLAVEAAHHDDTPAGRAHSHHGLALALAWAGRSGEARTHLDLALDAYAALEDHTGLAHTHRTIAFVLQREGHHEQALHHAERTLAHYRTAGHTAGEASACNAIGWYRAQLGDLTAALGDCERALELFEQVGNRTGIAYTWDSLGFIQQGLGRSDEAVRCYERALSHFRDLGDVSSEAETLTGLARAQHTLGHSNAAVLACREALALTRRHGLPRPALLGELLHAASRAART